MVYRDNGFGDSFAREVLNVMNSKEHKQMFNKKAQFMPEVDFGEEAREEALNRELPERRVEGPVTQTPEMKDWGTPAEPVGGIGEPVVDQIPGVPDQTIDATILKEKADRLMSDPATSPEVLDVANKAAMGKPLTPAEKDLLLTASNKSGKMGKKGQEIELPTDYVVSKSEWDTLPEDKKTFLREKYGDPPWEKQASNVIDTLVVVADYLGEKGFTVSENLADRLIKSVIVEASKKTAAEKCEKCECDPCECDEEEKKD
jgi:hypothetical protein